MSSIPLACALSADHLRCAADQLLPGLAREARTISVGTDEVHLDFASVPGVVERIAGVIERERQCCPFFSFRLDVSAESSIIGLDISGPPGTGEFLAGLSVEFRRPAG